MTCKINIFKPFLVLLTFVFSFSAFAYEPVEKDHNAAAAEPAKQAAQNAEKSGKFNAGELIIGHITDAHDWHIAGDEEHPIAVPLPVILYSKERGLSVFL